MHIFKVFSIAVLMSTALMSNSNSSESIIVKFQNDREYYISCGNKWKLANTVSDFSHSLNDIAGEYIRFNSINARNNNIIFNDFHSNENKPCDLQLQGNINYKPNIVLHYGYNKVILPNSIAWQNIHSIKIYSSLYDDITSNECKPMKINIKNTDILQLSFNDKPMPNEKISVIIDNNIQITDFNLVWLAVNLQHNSPFNSNCIFHNLGCSQKTAKVNWHFKID